MGRKWILGLVGIVGVAALAGIGFAQFTATATISGTATAGSYGPITIGSAGTYVSSGIAACSVSGSGNAGTYSASGFNPGDYCTTSPVISVGGNLPGTLTETVTLSGTTNCGATNWTESDTIGSGYSLVGGGSFTDYITVTLLSSAPSGCNGASVGLTIDIVGTST